MTSEVQNAKTEAAAIAALADSEPVLQEHSTHDQDAATLFTAILRGDDGGQSVDTIDLERHRFAPRDRRATVQVHTPDALVAYAKRHLDKDASTLWADVDGARVTVVLNDHAIAPNEAVGGEYAGWADHRCELALHRSPEWKAWTTLDEKPLGQVELAEFLEEHTKDVAEPDGAVLLEIARTFHATSGARFKSAVSLHSGETQLVYEETVEGRAGQGGDTKVPREFAVALRPFLGHDKVVVTARFFYRVREGRLALGFRLLNLEDISREAVTTIVTDVAGRLDLEAIEGTAPGARR